MSGREVHALSAEAASAAGTAGSQGDAESPPEGRDAALERDLRSLLGRYGIAIDEGTPSPSARSSEGGPERERPKPRGSASARWRNDLQVRQVQRMHLLVSH